MKPPKQAVVSGSFDDIRSHHLRFLQEASAIGELTVALWSDKTVLRQTGRPPKFPFPERLYFLNAVRYVSSVLPLPEDCDVNALPLLEHVRPRIWVDEESTRCAARSSHCARNHTEYLVLGSARLAGFPEPPPMPSPPGRKKVVATGCYDWFHSGHVRFTEEASAYGDLYVIVGHDANIRLLKGEGHPLLTQEERRYVVGSIKHVKQALISTGDGWLDADPEIRRLKPDAYIVNEDGDKGGKREYCQTRDIEYIVLKRAPAPGLPARSSTNLRGF
jgi:cytidyltransferase-like protein